MKGSKIIPLAQLREPIRGGPAFDHPMIVRRWQDLSGQEALLDGCGRTFQQIQAERQPPASTGEI